MNVLDLFSGIGGFSIGLERAGMKTVAFCEIEPYPQAVLRKNFPGVPIYDDVRTVTANRLRADGIDTVDLVCGGFPCQPFSVAGEQRGAEDDRFLWPEMFRVIQEFEPSWVIGENVAGFISMELENACVDLESAGYRVQPLVIPACAVGTIHKRDRVWILAHSERKRREGYKPHDSISSREATPYTKPSNRVLDSWDTVAKRARNIRRSDGVPVKVVRSEVKGYGNAVIPQIPEIIGKAIMQIERDLTCN